MERVLVACLLFIFAGIGHASQTPLCCPGGEPVLFRRQGVYQCWDSRADTTWPISLKCANPAHLPQGDGLSLLVDPDGDLKVQMKNREIFYQRNKLLTNLRSSNDIDTHIDNWHTYKVLKRITMKVKQKNQTIVMQWIPHVGISSYEEAEKLASKAKFEA